MKSPRYDKQKLWETFLSRVKVGDRIPSLTGRSSHQVDSIDHGEQEYRITYNTEKRSSATITLDDLYALYCELYSNGWLTNKYMKKHVKRILGWKSWHAPGSAMFAVLPLLDNNIDVRVGELHLKRSRQP